MTNFAARIFFFVIGFLIICSMIINHWIHKELKTTVEPAVPIEVEEPSSLIKNPEQDYEIDLTNDSPQSGPADQDILGSKKPGPIRDEKIIYEMPTSNKFLVQ